MAKNRLNLNLETLVAELGLSQGWAFSDFDTYNPNPNPIFGEKLPQIGGEPQFFDPQFKLYLVPGLGYEPNKC